MSSSTQYQVRTPPSDPELIREAQSKPNGFLYEIDYAYPDDQPTPPEAIRGAWEIDSQGQFTGRYSVNERYRAMQHPQRTLKPYMHAAAKTNRNQWIVEIDPRGESAFPSIPEHLIRVWWYVDNTGKITNHFRPNSRWIDDSTSTY